MEDVHQFFSKDPSIKLGGHWKPSDCLPRWKVSGRLGAPGGAVGARYWEHWDLPLVCCRAAV